MQRNEDNWSKAIKSNTLNLESNGHPIVDNSDIPHLVKFLKNHPKITDLNLMGRWISDHSMAILAEVDTITSLNLGYTYDKTFTLQGIKTLANSTHLKKLSLKNIKIGDEGAAILAANNTLEDLDLQGCDITRKGASFFSKNRSLKKLNLCYNKIGPAGAIMLAWNPSLRSLDISYNKIGDKGTQIFGRNHTLEILNVYHNGLTYMSAYPFSINDTLKKLIIGGNNIGDTGAKILSTNTHLEILDLSCADIHDSGIEQLAKNNTLKELQINANPFGNEGAFALGKNKSLYKLDVCTSNIQDKGAIALAANTQLRILEIAQTRITDKGLIALAANHTLRELEIGFSDKFTNKGFIPYINNNTLCKMEIRETNITKEIQKIIDKKIAKNAEEYQRICQTWMKYILLIAGIKGTKYSAIKYSLISILPIILEMADIPKENHLEFKQSCNRLMNTSFFKARILEKKSTQYEIQIPKI